MTTEQKEQLDQEETHRAKKPDLYLRASESQGWEGFSRKVKGSQGGRLITLKVAQHMDSCSKRDRAVRSIRRLIVTFQAKFTTLTSIGS